MKFQINITNIETVDEIREYWTDKDYIELLDRFDFPDAKSIQKEELRDFLFMAISDFKPHEAAAILLEYKLSEFLTKGQISQMSHEMLEDNLSEEYSDISLHDELFHINQLLYKAYRGKFPHAKATIIHFNLKQISGDAVPITKEVVLKTFGATLSDRCVVKRLFEDQLSEPIEFPEAEDIIWQLQDLGNQSYKVLTSEYWMNNDDFLKLDYEHEISLAKVED